MTADVLRPAAVTTSWDPPVVLRWEDGVADPIPIDRFLGQPTPEELDLLVGLPAPVLDVGCGPGRHVAELASRGVAAMGVEPAPSAAALARIRGAPVLERSVFDLLLGAGRWGSALLFDGTIGIGGDPDRLLRRIRTLLRPGGRAVLEAGAPGSTASVMARLEAGGRLGPWFPWSRVGADAVHRLAAGAGFRVRSVHQAGGRWFARMEAR
jgi:SAM-dependent methyltransferase